jgi:DeoR/GlpR family transcriptional regulator of sugar metabolism
MIKSANHRELVPARQQRIHDLVRERGVIRVDEVCAALGVSPATVRRDLEALEKRGRIRRVHGGALSTDSRLDEPFFDDKAAIASIEKQKIARKALSLIRERETIYLDGGSTVLELARLIRDRTDLVVVTNSLRAALELSGAEPRLILIGGELRRRSQSLVGTLTRPILRELHVDKAFMGTMGFSAASGMTTTDPNEAFTKMMVMENSETVVLLADSTKEGSISFARAGELSDIDVLITDNAISAAARKELKGLGIEVMCTK